MGKVAEHVRRPSHRRQGILESPALTQPLLGSPAFHARPLDLGPARAIRKYAPLGPRGRIEEHALFGSDRHHAPLHAVEDEDMILRHEEPAVVQRAAVVHHHMDMRMRPVGVQRSDVRPDIVLMRA